MAVNALESVLLTEELGVFGQGCAYVHPVVPFVARGSINEIISLRVSSIVKEVLSTPFVHLVVGFQQVVVGVAGAIHTL